MVKKRKRRRLVDAYAFPGFRPLATVQGMFGDPQARIVTLVRRGKKRLAMLAEQFIGVTTTAQGVVCAICPAGTFAFGSIWKCGAYSAVVATQ